MRSCGALLRHDGVRNELLGDLSEDGRRQYEAFGTVHEACQVAVLLAELREAANLAQRQAAKLAGGDRADLYRIESGQVIPSVPTLLRLLDAVGSTLVSGVNSPASEGKASKVRATRRSA